MHLGLRGQPQHQTEDMGGAVSGPWFHEGRVFPWPGQDVIMTGGWWWPRTRRVTSHQIPEVNVGCYWPQGVVVPSAAALGYVWDWVLPEGLRSCCAVESSRTHLIDPLS